MKKQILFQGAVLTSVMVLSLIETSEAMRRAVQGRVNQLVNSGDIAGAIAHMQRADATPAHLEYLKLLQQQFAQAVISQAKAAGSSVIEALNGREINISHHKDLLTVEQQVEYILTKHHIKGTAHQAWSQASGEKYHISIDDFIAGVRMWHERQELLNPDDGDALLTVLRSQGVPEEHLPGFRRVEQGDSNEAELRGGFVESDRQESRQAAAASTVSVRVDSEGVAIREAVRAAVTEGEPDDLNTACQIAEGYGVGVRDFVEGLDAIAAGY